MISYLKNPVMTYAWGSKTAISDLLGQRSPSDRPQAELWMGAHPKAPSEVFLDGKWVRLDEAIEKDPAGMLGKARADRFSNRFPFLFKYLAAGEPLSIQAHPTLLQAKEGFERENRLGIPIDDARRNYRDDNHKPEIICALTPFHCLNGFRPLPEIMEYMEMACGQTLDLEISALKADPGEPGLKTFLRDLLTLPDHRKKAVISDVVARSREFGGGNPIWDWIVKLDHHYPNDIGVLGPLFLNLIELSPGEAMYLPAGQMHAYLSGTGIELMANSDNVIRGGLTGKHMDVDELLKILRFESGNIDILSPDTSGERVEHVYGTEAAEFVLSVIRLEFGDFAKDNISSAEMMLCVEGEAVMRGEGGGLPVKKGDALFVSAAVESYRLEGRAVIYRAGVP